MYRYEYVTISGDGFFGGRGFSEHREMIDQYAHRGYRYIGFVPVDISGNGVVTQIDLIFEQELQKGEIT